MSKILMSNCKKGIYVDKNFNAVENCADIIFFDKNIFFKNINQEIDNKTFLNFGFR